MARINILLAKKNLAVLPIQNYAKSLQNKFSHEDDVIEKNLNHLAGKLNGK